jgi:hypothetical protein
MSFKTKLFREKVRQAPEKFKNSRFFLGLVMLTIGISWTVSYYEFRELWREYQEVIRYMEDRYPMAGRITIVNEAKAAMEAPVEEPVAEEVPRVDEEVEDVADTIFALESSKGKNDGCQRYGKWNGYGYRQNSSEFVCFESRDEVRGYVMGWIKEKRSIGMTTDEMLCYYNTGVRSSSCWYSGQAKLLEK